LKYEELVKGKVLESEEFKSLCKRVQKIIIFVRDSDDLPPYILNQASSKIPTFIKDRAMIRCLQSFAKNKISTEHKE
jgi:hypothetical protein